MHVIIGSARGIGRRDGRCLRLYAVKEGIESRLVSK